MGRETASRGSVGEDEVGYSRAVHVGDYIEVSGTTATDDGDLVRAGDAYAQARQTNVESTIEAAGGTLDDVVHTRTFVTDIADYEAVGRAHSEAFDDVRPTSMYEVAGLVDSEMLVEIEATAIVEG